ncbi:MAG: sugar ABC transporter substrate-binding protein [Defluviitaleaceae bacterium]|nr:sugar ABC transporter substrate-binding protein [Defluviitaleaceae bacterium]
MKKLLLILSLLLIFAACKKNPSTEETFTEQQNEIRVLLPQHPYADILIAMLPEFENETGIKVNFEQMNENNLAEIQVNGIAEKTFTADVFMTRPPTESLMFLKNDWVAPLENYDFSDYPQNTIEIGVKNDVPHLVPLIVEWHVLYYRKDLFAAAGINVPTNFAELEEAAKILNKDGVSGFASRGAGFPAVSQLSSFIYNFGGRYIENGEAVFDSPQALEAIRLYGRLLGVSGPSSVNTMSWSEVMSLFQAGNLAMWTDASVFYGQIVDPEVSQVSAENVGVAKFPAGPVSDEPYLITAWGMSISSMTRDIDSAEKFLNWATSREMAKKAMLANIPMTRRSVWNDESVTVHINPEIVETMLHASQYGYPYAMPLMTSIFRARESIGEVISESINTGGTSPRLNALATQKVAEVNELLKTDGEFGTAK